jgi:hypothetical protein
MLRLAEPHYRAAAMRMLFCMRARARKCVYVCVCVCARARARSYWSCVKTHEVFRL